MGAILGFLSGATVMPAQEEKADTTKLNNPLKITNDARKAGLDFRLIDPEAADEPQTKINVAIENILRLYYEWSTDRGTQLVFCDLSTPKAKKQTSLTPSGAAEDGDDVPALSMDEILAGSAKFSVYDDIKAKLLARGIPESEVRFIHDATTDLQKSKLFDEMNRGDVRILLGSTAKMGAGTNVQRRLVALHHLDAPWRPSDLEQREGRILRQGNALYERDPDNFQIEVLRYATKQTYDSRMWQTIEYKAAGIEQFRKGDSLQRVIEDVAGEAANAAEMKAAATGNPLIFLQVQLSSDLKKLEALYSNHKRNLHSLERRIEWLSSADERADKAVQRWTKEIDRRNAAATPDFKFVAGGRTYGSDDKPALVNRFASVMKEAHQMKTASPWEAPRLVDVGEYRGFKVQVSVHLDTARFTVFGHDSYEPDNMRYSKDDSFSLNGFINRMDNFLDKFEAWRAAAEHGRHREKEELQKAVAEKAKPFSQQARLEALRQDVRDVMSELKIMQGDPEYVSTWKPSSQQQNDQSRYRAKAAS
nr:helicase C-terminal domain-containing protein [Stutzerimonas stutzeri]